MAIQVRSQMGSSISVPRAVDVAQIDEVGPAELLEDGGGFGFRLGAVAAEEHRGVAVALAGVDHHLAVADDIQRLDDAGFRSELLERFAREVRRWSSPGEGRGHAFGKVERVADVDDGLPG